MNLQLFSEEATVGKDYLLYIEKTINPDANDPWAIIGGQRSATIDESNDEIDVSHKTSGGYKSTLAGLTSWSIDFDGMALLPGSDEGIEELKKAKAQKKTRKFKVRYPDNNFRIGFASSTSYSIEAPHDGEATVKGKLSGNGPISNESVTVDKTAATDQTFYFEGSALATSVKLEAATVLAANYIATTPGEITIKGTYLETLDAGEHLFYVYLSIGGYALVAIRIV